MRGPRAVVWLMLIGIGGFGAAFLLFPRFMASLVEIQLPTATARIDYMASYGGVEVGIAAFLGWCLRRDERLQAGLLASGWILLCIVATRVVGILLAGEVRPVLYLLLASEAAGVALCFWALPRARAAAGRANRR